jgi:hypothetical protein
MGIDPSDLVEAMRRCLAPEVQTGKETLEIVERIKPLLAGHEPVVQSAVLAELLSIWLAGHWIAKQCEQTSLMRRALLSAHCSLVWELTLVNAEMMETNGD